MHRGPQHPQHQSPARRQQANMDYQLSVDTTSTPVTRVEIDQARRFIARTMREQQHDSAAIAEVFLALGIGRDIRVPVFTS